MTKLEIAFKTIGWLIILIVMIIASIGLKGCIKEWNEEVEAREVRAAAYNARYPKVGDKIELDGKEIVILKSYIFSRRVRFEVRLPNGNITDVMGVEIIDKKPIEKVPE